MHHSDGCMCVDMRAYVPEPAPAPGTHTLSGYSEYSLGTVRGHQRRRLRVRRSTARAVS